MDKVLSFHLTYDEAEKIAAVLSRSSDLPLLVLGLRLTNQLAANEEAYARFIEAQKDYLKSNRKRVKRKLP